MTGTYNLLREPWLRVLRRDGSYDFIRPAQLVERENPVVRLATGRADFDAAATQLLVGLMQRGLPPSSDIDWGRRFRKPPAVAEVDAALEPFASAFFLDGDGPRFFQDLELPTDPPPDPQPIEELLIESANAELFVKQGRIGAMSFHAAALSLLTMNLNAPSGGRGHRTSLRGGGPLTTLILGEDLWETVWLNVLSPAALEQLGDATKVDLQHTFPWLAPTRTSEKDRGTSPEHVHPAQMYFPLPRRIRLVIQPNDRGRCDVLGLTDVPVVRAYVTRPYGVKYEGFEHPLTPHKRMKEGEPKNPKKAQSDGLPYREWPQLVLNADDGEPAAVVHAYYARDAHEKQARRSLWVSGFDVDKIKARCWYEHETPLFHVPPASLPAVSARVAALVVASEEARRTLVKQAIAAMKRRPEDEKKPWSSMQAVALSQSFWDRTEAAFFEAVAAIVAEPERKADVEGPEERWLVTLHTAALSEFDRTPEWRSAVSDGDMRRVVLARRDLDLFTRPSSSNMRKAVGLPVLEKSSTKKSPGRKKKTADVDATGAFTKRKSAKKGKVASE